MKRTRQNGRANGVSHAKARPRGRLRKKHFRSPSEAASEMKRIMALRGRGKSLHEACKEVGVSVQTYYYRLNHAVYAGGRRGKSAGNRPAIVPANARSLVSSLDRFQKAVTRLRTAIASACL